MEATPLATRDLLLVRLAVVAALAMSGLLLFVAVLLFVRLLSGGLNAKLDAFALLSIGVVLLAVLAAPRLAGACYTSARENRAVHVALLVVPALAVVMAITTLSFASLNVWPLALVWLGLAAEEGTWWTLHFRRRRPSRAATRLPAQPANRHVEPLPSPATEIIHEPGLEDEDQVSDNVVQQVTRVRDTDGGESLHGVLRGDFAPGERNQNLHIAFCPPLAAVPEFTFEQVEGPSATIKAGQVEMFGARLEVRLDAPPREAAQVLVEFSAATRGGAHPGASGRAPAHS